MLLNLTDLIRRYKLKITGVIHVGGHFGEETADYHQNGIKDIVYIEPAKAAYQVLQLKFAAHHHIKLFNVACGAENGTALMHTETANKGQSNSLLKPVEHLKHYPDIQFKGTEEVRVCTLDSLNLGARYNLLNMDVQGFENRVLLGGKETLKHIDYVYTEVNQDGANLYQGAAGISELDALLSDFDRVETKWVEAAGWGDALFVRKTKPF